MAWSPAARWPDEDVAPPAASVGALVRICAAVSPFCCPRQARREARAVADVWLAAPNVTVGRCGRSHQAGGQGARVIGGDSRRCCSETGRCRNRRVRSGLCCRHRCPCTAWPLPPLPTEIVGLPTTTRSPPAAVPEVAVSPAFSTSAETVVFAGRDILRHREITGERRDADGTCARRCRWSRRRAERQAHRCPDSAGCRHRWRRAYPRRCSTLSSVTLPPSSRRLAALDVAADAIGDGAGDLHRHGVAAARGQWRVQRNARRLGCRPGRRSADRRGQRGGGRAAVDIQSSQRRGAAEHAVECHAPRSARAHPCRC